MLAVGSSRKLTLELFPFISLFLCVIGVLAFLQNLLVMGDIGASEEDADQPQIFQTSYQIDTYPDRLVLLPPDSPLTQLRETLTLDEQAGIDSIIAGRGFIREAQGLELDLGPNFNEDYLRIALNEIATINRVSKERGLAYEEYILFQIHSGGSDAYHYLVNLLDLPQYSHIRSGLDIADFDAAEETQAEVPQ